MILNKKEHLKVLVSRFNASLYIQVDIFDRSQKLISLKDPGSLYISNKLLLLKCYTLVNK